MEYVMVFYYPILLVYYVFCYLSIDRYMVDASSSFAWTIWETLNKKAYVLIYLFIFVVSWVTIWIYVHLSKCSKIY